MAQTSPMCLDVNGDMIEISHSADTHAYLGRLLCGHLVVGMLWSSPIVIIGDVPIGTFSCFLSLYVCACCGRPLFPVSDKDRSQ